MKAALIREIGGLPELAETDVPERASGRALVRIHAVPLNPIDVVLASGKHLHGPSEDPVRPGLGGRGHDRRGRLARAGHPRLHLGRPARRSRTGRTLAELATVAEEEALELPDGVSDELAAACGTAGVAGWLPVVWRAQVGPADRVLVLGGTGTVGLAAVQAARLQGAERIVAAGRRPERLEEARQAGAHAVVRLDEPDLAGALKEAAGGDGPTVVIDPLWGEPLVAATEAAAPDARVVQIEQSAGPAATLASGVVRGKQLEIYGYSNFVVPAEHRRAAYAALVAHAARGEPALPDRHVSIQRRVPRPGAPGERPGAKLVVRLD